MSFLIFSLPCPDVRDGVSKRLGECSVACWVQPTTVFLHKLKELKKDSLMNFNERVSSRYNILGQFLCLMQMQISCGGRQAYIGNAFRHWLRPSNETAE